MSFVGAFIGLSIWAIEHQRMPVLIFDIQILPYIIGILLLFGFIFSWVPWGAFDADSVTTLNTLGLPRKALWSEVTKAKKRNILGLTCLCLYTEHSRFAIWVPLNIKRAKQLQQFIHSSNNQVIINALS